MTVFAAPANAAPTSPVFTGTAALWRFAGLRRAPFRLPLPGSFGVLSHVTFSCCAAWIASHSCGATTPTKLPF